MDEAAVDVVRKFYESIAERDMDKAEGCFAADALWHLPGKSPISGDHFGWAAIRDEFLLKLAPLSGGTFRAELLDVAVGERYVVAIQHATGAFGGRVLDITGCQLMRVEAGLIREVRGHYSNQELLDSFWEEPAN
ncbi:nuclear transport factor 2 family protein [Arthrobacter alpinus]|uniref:nuclear transport factor 2 family protein n=1 Tax=Arthrobacter alpinus TaxID=656366 RepID=UPI00164499C2|nr:nuclear transport factor 2 family protein [Arthrobacter alpinus]